MATPDELITRACERAGLDDFGGDSWREGLHLLVDSVESTPGVNPGGRDFVYGQFVDALWNRLRIVDYLKQHPEIHQERVERSRAVCRLGAARAGERRSHAPDGGVPSPVHHRLRAVSPRGSL
jgi:hypothetical protein